LHKIDLYHEDIFTDLVPGRSSADLITAFFVLLLNVFNYLCKIIYYSFNLNTLPN